MERNEIYTIEIMTDQEGRIASACLKDDYSKLIGDYAAYGNLSFAARQSCLSTQKAKRILLSCGIVLKSERTTQILRLHGDGASVAQIATLLGISKKAVRVHMPYEKGEYRGSHPSSNALKIRRHRQNRAAIEKGMA